MNNIRCSFKGSESSGFLQFIARAKAQTVTYSTLCDGLHAL